LRDCRVWHQRKIARTNPLATFKKKVETNTRILPPQSASPFIRLRASTENNPRQAGLPD
jgi:hypothetical protein